MMSAKARFKPTSAPAASSSIRPVFEFLVSLFLISGRAGGDSMNVQHWWRIGIRRGWGGGICAPLLTEHAGFFFLFACCLICCRMTRHVSVHDMSVYKRVGNVIWLKYAVSRHPQYILVITPVIGCHFMFAVHYLITFKSFKSIFFIQECQSFSGELVQYWLLQRSL